MTSTTTDLRRWMPTRSTGRAVAPSLILVALCGVAAPALAAGPASPPVSPTPLGATASATPEVESPAPEPQPLVVTPPPAGASGPTVARGEGRVAAGRPRAFQFRAESAGLTTIGVSSPQNGARLSIFLGSSSEAASSTSATDGAIRWSSELAAGETVKIVVYTNGAEIPFRVEAFAGPGGL